MIQEKTGVSACEILFGRNPNLPSDLAYTSATSLSNDREGYLKQLKRALKDIRQKLGRILGQNQDQKENPFSVGDKVIIAILPHENAHKLMAKRKGPFVVNKIPNQFQIEYSDGNVTQLTHISHAKRFNERCHYAGPVGLPRGRRVSNRQAWARMARLRLAAEGGRRRARRVVSSLQEIQEQWPVVSGRVRVKVLGNRQELPPDLLAVVEAAGHDGCLEGRDLVDLCVQRSGQMGSGCDAPAASEELPLPVAAPPSPSTWPAIQVKQYSCHHYVKNDISGIRREYVGMNKSSNHNCSTLPQQDPLVARVHLLDVIRKVG